VCCTAWPPVGLGVCDITVHASCLSLRASVAQSMTGHARVRQPGEAARSLVAAVRLPAVQGRACFDVRARLYSWACVQG